MHLASNHVVNIVLIVFIVVFAFVFAASVYWYARSVRKERLKRLNLEDWQREIDDKNSSVSSKSFNSLLHTLLSDPEDPSIKEDEVLVCTRRKKILLAPAVIMAVMACLAVSLAGYAAVTGVGTLNVPIPNTDNQQSSGLPVITPIIPTPDEVTGKPSKKARGGHATGVPSVRGGQAKPENRYFHIPVLLPITLVAAFAFLAVAFASWLQWYSHFLLVTNLCVRLQKLPPYWLPFASRPPNTLQLNQIQDVNYGEHWFGKIFGFGTLEIITLQGDEDDARWKSLRGWPKYEQLHKLLQRYSLSRNKISALEFK